MRRKRPSPLWMGTVVSETCTRKNLMKHNLLALHTVFRQKYTVILLALTALGLVGGGSFLLQPTSVHAAPISTRCSYATCIPTATHTATSTPAPLGRAAAVKTPPPTNTPVPPVTQTPTSGGQGGTTNPGGSVANMIVQVFGPYSAQALRIAQCESGLNPAAYNPTSIGGSHAAGVFQILYPSTWSSTPQAASSPYNAWANIQAAHSIFVRDGYSWREWSCQ